MLPSSFKVLEVVYKIPYTHGVSNNDRLPIRYMPTVEDPCGLDTCDVEPVEVPEEIEARDNSESPTGLRVTDRKISWESWKDGVNGNCI